MTKGRWPRRLIVVLALTVVAAGCASGSAFRRGEDLMRRGDLDMAVASYRKAVQADPDNAHYKIALQRAMLAASRMHLDRAKQYEAMDQLEAALGEYRLASEYDPSNRQITAKVAELDRTLRTGRLGAFPSEACYRDRARTRQGRGNAAPAAEPEYSVAPTSIQQREPSRHPERDRRRNRREHHVRSAIPGSAVHRPARWRNARGGSQSDPQRKPALLQGVERALDPRLRRQRAEARAVRRPGHSDLLPLERGRHRARADFEPGVPSAGHRGAAGDCAKQ